MKHKENVARKLRQMRIKADTDKKEAALAEASMQSIEAAARKAYEKDLAAQQACAQANGDWVFDDASGHHYNSALRYYYNRENGMYYGGDPPAWTTMPDIPPEALFKASVTLPSNADSAPAPAPQKPAASKSVGGPSQARPAKHAHPLQTLGGYQMPVHGKIGGQKGVGAVEPTSQASVKRKRDDTGANGTAKSSKPLTPDEAKALAAREAARQRVQMRTAQGFGLGL
ncbi:g3388 [Coccomyxa viridis]|uniref:G3388 protein n=1 Tax=Coccomyxa viridis TaxID=1274662 RepID=A0ABP1FRN6_9CHLO